MPDDGSINIISDFSTLPLSLFLSISRESPLCTQCLFLFVFLTWSAIACVGSHDKAKQERASGREACKTRICSTCRPADRESEPTKREIERRRGAAAVGDWQSALALALSPSGAQYTVNRSCQHVVVSVAAAVVCSLSLSLFFYAPVECCFETDAKPTTNAKSVKRSIDKTQKKNLNQQKKWQILRMYVLVKRENVKWFSQKE